MCRRSYLINIGQLALVGTGVTDGRAKGEQIEERVLEGCTYAWERLRRVCHHINDIRQPLSKRYVPPTGLLSDYRNGGVIRRIVRTLSMWCSVKDNAEAYVHDLHQKINLCSERFPNQLLRALPEHHGHGGTGILTQKPKSQMLILT